MTSIYGPSMYESQSITKPPLFNGDNYPFWKNLMRLFIKSNDYVLWDVMEYRPTIPMKRDDEGRLVTKTKVEMTDEDRRKI
ncbi:hypothetical protein HRI_000695100 [Hibiscus trionum]|uniref:DUF4219 domain-containing protein n=1 Tax=Hibiscus trionum TaxID=183268 RepID=A0A9W7H403_HIBTR|nr:hypothetical protein HRI_000695100 [Hibiscus trionum]